MVDSLWFSALALIIFITVIHKLFISNKQKYHNLPPSPPSLPIIGHLHLLKQPVHRTLQSLSETYGKVLLLRWGSRKVLLLTSPSAAEECFTKNDIIFTNRPRMLAGKDLTLRLHHSHLRSPRRPLAKPPPRHDPRALLFLSSLGVPIRQRGRSPGGAGSDHEEKRQQ
ncbi:hypothetical protein ACLB2K_009872 [Fragaria x ananassa]